MPEERHSVRKQTLHVVVDSEALAFALQPRLQDIQRAVLLQTMERVFDEFSAPDQHIRIDSLSIDLGTIPFVDLEWVVVERFERELRNVLRKTTRELEIERQSSGESLTRSSRDAHLELVERYLTTGTLPFWAPAATFNLEELIGGLFASDPAGLARLFQRRGSNGQLLRRTVHQLSDEALRRLLHVLAPADASVILLHLRALRDRHAGKPLVKVTDQALGRVLWLTALTYVLQNPGTPFNRNTFAQSLRQGLEEELDVAIGSSEAVDASSAVAADDVESPASSLVWDVHRIQSILGSRARAARGSSAHEPSSTSLLIRLVEADAEGARHFLRALMDGGILPSSLIDEMPSPRAVDTMQRLLTPDAAGRVRLLVRMLAALPPASRPGFAAQIHAVILREVLDHFADPEPGPAFLETLLRPLFDLPLAPDAAERLEPFPPSRDDQQSPVPPISGPMPRDDGAWAADSGYDRARTLLTIAAQVVEAGEFTAAEMRPFTVALDEALALDWLRHPGAGAAMPGSRSLPDDALRDALRRLLDRAPDTIHRVVADSAGDPQVRQQWATVLSESELVRMAYLLEPRQHRQLLDAAELLFSAWLQVAPERDAPFTSRTAFWSFLLEFLAAGDRSARSLERLVDRFFGNIGVRDGGASTGLPLSGTPASDTLASGDQGGARQAETGKRLVRAATRLAAQAGHAELRAILERDGAAALARERTEVPVNLPAAEAAPPLFARYDRVEALRYYLRHGVLPWSVSLRDATLTVADTLDVLVDLPFSLLTALVQDLGPRQRLEVWQRVARELPDDRLHHFIAALIAHTDRPPAATWSRLSADAEHATDRSLVYAQFIAQVIGAAGRDDEVWHTPLDTAVPAGAADTSGVTAASDIENVESPASARLWETHRIKSILASRARGAPGAGVDAPSSTSLLIRLVEADVEDARHFLQALMDGGIPPSSLIDEMPSPRGIDTVQTLLTPGAAGRVRLILRMLAALPAAVRPGPEAHVHAVILREVLDRFAGPQLGPTFFETVLRPLFDLPVAAGAPARPEPFPPSGRDQPLPVPPLSGAMPRDDIASAADSRHDRRVRTLLTIAAHVVEAGEFTAAEMQPFTAALTRVNQQAEDGEPARGTVAPPAAFRGEGPVEPRQPEEIHAHSPLSPDEARALDWLRHADAGPGTTGSPSLPDDTLRDALRRLLDRAPDAVRRVVGERVGDPQVRQQWVTVLSQSELVRMAYLLEPRQHRQLLDAAELLFSAWLQVAPDRDAPLTSRAAFWSFVLEFLAAGDRSARSLARLVDRFLGDVVAHDRVASTSLPASGIPSIETPPISERRTDSGERLVRAATRLAAQGGHAELRAILERDGAAAPARERTETPANLLEPEAAPPLFARYDRVEALRYYLRHGVLPWSLSLRDATLTVADTLDVLVDLPFSLLHALVQNLRPDERLQVWQRVARELPGDRLHDLIAALIARTDRPPAVTWSRLSADAEHAADRSLVYAQSITQLIGDDAARQMSLDTAVPEGAADTSGATAASDIENVESPASAGPWETDRIKSILASRARGAPNSAAHEPSSTSLLIRLVEADAEGARHFLRALMDGGIPPSSLIDEMPSPRAIDTVQTLLTPDAAGRVRLMLRMLAALPAALRPGPEAHVHAVILREVLDHFADPQLGPAFFETVLRPLFDLPVAPGAADRLEPLVPALLDPPLPDRDSGPAVSGAISRDESSRTADSGYGRVRTLLTIAAQVVEAGEFTAAEMQPFTAALTRVNLQAVEGEPARDTVALPAALRGEGPIEPRQPEETAANGPLSADEARALDWLRHADGGPGTAGSPSLPDDAFRDALRRLLDRAPDPVRRVVADRVGDPQVRRRWATVLSESELVRMAFLLEPRQHRQVLDAAELLFSAWIQVATDRDAPLTRRTAFWSFVLEFLATGDRSARSLARLVDRFFADVGAHERSDSTSLPASAIPAIDTPAITDKRAETGERLVRAATRLAARAGHAALLAILERDRAALLGRGRGDTPAPPAPSAIDVRRPSPPHFDDSPARAGRPRSRTAFSMTDEEEEIGGEPIYIANAGLILTHPFLPQLFQSLDMLERAEDGRRRLIADQVSRAVHLLQSLVDGRTSAPEPLLCLNKLLCGVPLSTPVERSVEATPRDLEICRTLLNSLIANWPIISNTSVQGLQETFLQREGRLQRASDGWRLLVQRKTVDVLLDHIPWSISTITHGWMLEPIFVTW